jgi:hypothetical protein
MKINCATSSRSVMLFIHRRTVEDALSGGVGLLAARLAAADTLAGVAGGAPEAAASARNPAIKRESTTIPV